MKISYISTGNAVSEFDYEMIASHGGWSFYKVPTNCTTDICVASACSTAGMVTPCAGPSDCGYNNAICTSDIIDDSSTSLV